MQAVPAEGKKDALHLIVIGPPGAGAWPTPPPFISLFDIYFHF
jgi:hypothetical protein